MLLPTFAGQLFLASCFFSLALRREVGEEEADRMGADYADCTTPFLRNFGVTCFCPREFPNSNKACLNSDFAKQECDSGIISSTTPVSQVKTKTRTHVANLLIIIWEKRQTRHTKKLLIAAGGADDDDDEDDDGDDDYTCTFSVAQHRRRQRRRRRRQQPSQR